MALWFLLRDYCGHREYCWPLQETLAEQLGWNLKKVSRAMADLRAAGVVEVKPRGLGRSAFYYLKSTEPVKKSVERRARADQMPLDLSGPERTSGVRSLYELPTEPPLETQSERVGTRSSATDPPRDQANEFEVAGAQAIENAVKAAGFEPSDELLEKIERKRRFYGATAFQVAAAVERCLRRIEKTPSNAPRSEAWILRCVENEFFEQFGDPRRKPPASERHGGARSSGPPDDGAHRTRCRSLAEPGYGARGDPATGTRDGMRAGDGAVPLHETNPATPAWSDRAPPPPEFATAIFRLAHEKCVGARKARAG